MSKLFKSTLLHIKENKKNLQQDLKPNCIPFIWFPKLRTVIPGIIKGTNWIVTASTGVGKTQFTKYNFVYQPIKWIKENPESGLSYKILYFALEESKQEFMLNMISNRMFDLHGISLDILELQSMFEKALDDDIMKKIEDCEAYFDDLEDYVEIIDSISNPTGIYKYVRNYSLSCGTHYFYNFLTDKTKDHCIAANTIEEYGMITKDKVKYKNFAYSHYVPDNPDEYVGVIVDHFSLIEEEAGAETLHKAMSRMSASYGRKIITKHYNYFFINVQQQSADKLKIVCCCILIKYLLFLKKYNKYEKIYKRTN